MAKQAPRRLVDLGRLAILAAIVFLIRDAHEEFLAKQAAQRQPLTIEQAKRFFPTAHSFVVEDGILQVFDAEKNILGRLAQTAPQSDDAQSSPQSDASGIVRHGSGFVVLTR